MQEKPEPKSQPPRAVTWMEYVRDRRSKIAADAMARINWKCPICASTTCAAVLSKVERVRGEIIPILFVSCLRCSVIITYDLMLLGIDLDGWMGLNL